MSDSTDLNGQQICERVEDLIGAWCDQRTLKALRIVLPAWPPSGLTDDWHALLDALSHLIMEELLYRTVQSHCESPEHLDEARLRFPQLVALAKSLDKLPAAPPSLWASLAKLNTLRNSLAHSLELPDLDKRVVAFVEATLGHARVAALGPSSNSKEAVVTSLCFVLGQLEVVGVFTEALEWLIVNQLSNPTE